MVFLSKKHSKYQLNLLICSFIKSYSIAARFVLSSIFFQIIFCFFILATWVLRKSGRLKKPKKGDLYNRILLHFQFSTDWLISKNETYYVKIDFKGIKKPRTHHPGQLKFYSCKTKTGLLELCQPPLWIQPQRLHPIRFHRLMLLPQRHSCLVIEQ